MGINQIQKRYLDFYDWSKRVVFTRNARKQFRGYLSGKTKLTKEEKQQLKAFWKPYAKICPVFHTFYKEKTGNFHPEYLPTDLYLTHIDEYFNDRKAAHILDNKCLYPRLFPGIPQPKIVVCRMGGYWYNGDMQRITPAERDALINSEPAIFIKAATDSCGGKGVQYLDSKDGTLAEQFAREVKIKGDIVIQEPVRQHPVFAKMNASSVNTYRILTLLTEEGVKFYSVLVRIGINNRKVDNGGLSCGVQPDGKLREKAHRLNGSSFEKHPDHDFVFKDYQLISLEKAKALIEKAHPMVPHFRMVSWDIAINEQGEPIMLEANFSLGCLHFLQINNGPLLGEDTKMILDEVFKKN